MRRRSMANGGSPSASGSTAELAVPSSGCSPRSPTQACLPLNGITVLLDAVRLRAGGHDRGRPRPLPVGRAAEQRPAPPPPLVGRQDGGLDRRAWSPPAVAIFSFIGVYDGELFWDHMVQHLLLIMVAAPLFAIASPLELAWRSTTGTAHLVVTEMLRSQAAKVLGHPIMAFILYAVFIPVST